jgi:hypothetical protein
MATTQLRMNLSIENKVKGTYAAEAGVEEALWSFLHSQAPPAQVNGVNGMNVSLVTQNHGMFTIVLGEFVPTGVHYDYLRITSEVEWVPSPVGKYKYTIEVRLNGGSTIIHLASIGARLPDGYTYEDGSSDLFPGNLSDEEPDLYTDTDGNQMVNWEFDTPLPSVTNGDPVAEQVFYLVPGSEPPVPTEGNYYAWVSANREDVSPVGEFTGNMYHIVATATDVDDSTVTATITADVIIAGADILVIGWRITN